MFKTRIKIILRNGSYTLYIKYWYNLFWQQLIYSTDEDFIYHRFEIEKQRINPLGFKVEEVIWFGRNNTTISDILSLMNNMKIRLKQKQLEFYLPTYSIQYKRPFSFWTTYKVFTDLDSAKVEYESFRKRLKNSKCSDKIILEDIIGD